MKIPNVEWLEADGLGGFASGTASGLRSRRYHGLLLVASTPPTGRLMLVNGVEVWLETPEERTALTSHHYSPDVLYPDGVRRLESFDNQSWPKWRYRLDDGSVVEQELIVRHGAPVTAIRWRLEQPRTNARLVVRPLLSGRDYHSTHHENDAFRFESHGVGRRITWHPYEGIPAITALSNGRYDSGPVWFRNFLYEEERTRGLDHVEDLASPGSLTFDLTRAAVLLFTTDPTQIGDDAEAAFDEIRNAETGRRTFASPLHRAADTYLVRRGGGKTIVAGYPWFTDWGRDTFISIRGLCIATGRLDDARDILLAWADSVSQGMLPNRFPDQGDVAEFNSVDASLWYIVAVHDFLSAAASSGYDLPSADLSRLRGAVEAIVAGYAAGTRFGIRADGDGLLACGTPGAQLTWMDAKVGDWVVTPRIGKPVEVQALWLNALWIVGQWSDRWDALRTAAMRAFPPRFWNERDGMLYDVVDVDHRAGTVDATCRPNQILAVGGLPLMLIDKPAALGVVAAVEERLVTPMGLRSLAPGSPGYASHYEGTSAERDARYHQGTVWPWLLGPFVEAWLRLRRPSARARAEARDRFLAPLLELASQSGGHVPEIADAGPPHTPRGCPCQAWSVSELLRLEVDVLGRSASTAPRAKSWTPGAHRRA